MFDIWFLVCMCFWSEKTYLSSKETSLIEMLTWSHNTLGMFKQRSSMSRTCVRITDRQHPANAPAQPKPQTSAPSAFAARCHAYTRRQTSRHSVQEPDMSASWLRLVTCNVQGQLECCCGRVCRRGPSKCARHPLKHRPRDRAAPAHENERSQAEPKHCTRILSLTFHRDA